RGKLRQQGILGGLRITPVVGSSGPGAQMPIPFTLEVPVGRTCAIAESTACKPRSAESVETIVTRRCERISPAAFTSPAATLVPPTSTPTNIPCAGEPVFIFAKSFARADYAGSTGLEPLNA